MIGTIDRHTTSLLAIGGFVTLAAIGTAAYAGSTDGAAGAIAPVPCEVIATESGNTMNLEAIYNAHGPTNGTYRFSVRTMGGGGSTNINQGGGFAASEAGPVSLGRVSVGNAPSYDISLSVEVGGETYDCMNPDDDWA